MKHNYKPDGKYKSFDLIRNYCRNPSSHKKSNKGLWCYTNNPKKRWENCDPIKTATTTKETGGFKCKDDKCKTYRGK
jgi:hypothetical protein